MIHVGRPSRNATDHHRSVVAAVLRSKHLFIQALCRIMIAELEQHVNTYNLAGYNGGRCPPFTHAVLVHCRCCEFVRRAPESVGEDVNQLRSAATHHPRRLWQERQARGLKCELGALMFDEVREKMQPPCCQVGDWMRRFVAGGGIAQCGVSQLLTALAPLQLKDIDRCKIQVLLRGLTKLSDCLLYTSPSPRDRTRSRMPSSA